MYCLRCYILLYFCNLFAEYIVKFLRCILIDHVIGQLFLLGYGCRLFYFGIWYLIHLCGGYIVCKLRFFNHRKNIFGFFRVTSLCHVFCIKCAVCKACVEMCVQN